MPCARYSAASAAADSAAAPAAAPAPASPVSPPQPNPYRATAVFVTPATHGQSLTSFAPGAVGAPPTPRELLVWFTRRRFVFWFRSGHGSLTAGVFTRCGTSVRAVVTTRRLLY
ncbi:hypothetical protein Esi_0170_0076 [Ectocarpus siliculosus]|uniref:Uncharacterized protein n=1 Tax=Ectocarpus siliculosus TaxID=2880 RepID=D7FMU1_ECTSI|nr:hypothetical protein Esi_0170_0076 [Ectocarpus siliculosus]|eukprot:CBJ30006.1 hypothetical protein Esi_0170_0076 [Ectocarpus siliculosus]